MALHHTLAAIFLVFIVHAHDYDLAKQFSQFTKDNLPDDTYSKVFAVNADNADQLLKAAQKGTDTFNKVLGSDIDVSINNQLLDESKRLGIKGVTSYFLLNAYANTMGETLQDNGGLNHDNVGAMAQKYVDELNISAKSLRSTNILETFPSLTAANARLMKSLGLTSKENANQYANNLLTEAKKH